MKKKLVITGYSSNIISKFLIKIEKNKFDLDIIKCGRDSKADFKVDFNNFDQINKFNKFLIRSKPSYLIINHGILYGKEINKLSNRQISETVNINLISSLKILECLTKIKKLKTIYISSISGKKGSYDQLYAACKSGADLILKQISKVQDKDSRLNAISPGIISDAKMTLVRKDKNNLQKIKNNTPTRQFTNCDDIAELIFYLLFINNNIQGENININGGII